jgi:hypothetical protein
MESFAAAKPERSRRLPWIKLFFVVVLFVF